MERALLLTVRTECLPEAPWDGGWEGGGRRSTCWEPSRPQALPGKPAQEPRGLQPTGGKPTPSAHKTRPNRMGSGLPGKSGNTPGSPPGAARPARETEALPRPSLSAWEPAHMLLSPTIPEAGAAGVQEKGVTALCTLSATVTGMQIAEAWTRNPRVRILACMSRVHRDPVARERRL